MSAKDKATELIKLFKQAHWKLTLEAAKECALKCANEILDVVGQEVYLTGDKTIRAKAEFWNDVKHELLKFKA